MSQPESLSERELEILGELVTGASNREIARALDISPNTVKVHLRNVYEKLGVSSRTEATLVALRNGLVWVEGMDEGEEPFEEEPVEPPTISVAGDASSSVAPEVSSAPVIVEPPTDARPLRSRGLPTWVGILLGTTLLVVAGLLLVLVLRPPAAQAPSSDTVVAVVPPQRWRLLAQLPAPYSSASAVTAQRDLLLLGGEGREGPSAEVLRYDESVGRWESLAPLPQPVGAAAVAVTGGRLFVAGGMSSDGVPLRTVQQYDLSRNEWSDGPELPIPLARAALASFEGDLYLFGGWDGNDAHETIYRLRADATNWETVGTLTAPRMFLVATPLEEGIVLIGGQDGAGTALREVTFFDPLSGELRNEAPLPLAMPQPQATTLGTWLYALDEGTLLERDPRGEWQMLDPPDDETLPDDGALVAHDPYLIVAGGTQDGTPVAVVWQYQAIYRSFLPLGTSP